MEVLQPSMGLQTCSTYTTLHDTTVTTVTTDFMGKSQSLLMSLWASHGGDWRVVLCQLRLKAWSQPSPAMGSWGHLRLLTQPRAACSSGFTSQLTSLVAWWTCISPGFFCLLLFFFCSSLFKIFLIHLTSKHVINCNITRTTLSKPGPLIADLNNTASPATASHRAAAAAEAEWWIQAEIAAQRASEGSLVITPPPETPISPTNSNRQPLTPINLADEDRLDNLGDNLVRKSQATKFKHRAHVNGQSDS